MNLLDFYQFVELGYLQEANRKFFHPLGLSLVIQHGCLLVEDYRDIDGGVGYFHIDKRRMHQKEFYVSNEGKKKEGDRIKKFGSIIQDI